LLLTKVLLMPSQAPYMFLQSIGMIQVARISSFIIVPLRWLARGQSILPGTVLSTHNNLNATTLNTAEGERKMSIRGAYVTGLPVHLFKRPVSGNFITRKANDPDVQVRSHWVG
jgi:hypothetical protein